MKINEYEISTQEDVLYESMMKCKNGKMWKASVARYVLHGIEETLDLADAIKDGKYKPRKPHEFELFYPKRRPCSSIHFKDRIVQRSLNDNVIYPIMTENFIWDNMACQQGKGTTAAMDRLDHFLHRLYINNGNSVQGLWVLQADIQGYYRSMRHDVADNLFTERLPECVATHAIEWLHNQYPGDIGYAPGSQMVQILGISMLNHMDHAIKEQAGAKTYSRYMDDFYIISSSKQFLESCLAVIEQELDAIGLHLHPAKTKIYPLSKGIKVLGFTFRLTNTGKVIRIIDPDNVKHERKKLYRMAQLVKDGKMRRSKMLECYDAWKAHARLGNSYKLIRRMDAYVKELLREVNQNEDQTDDRQSARTSCSGESAGSRQGSPGDPGL